MTAAEVDDSECANLALGLLSTSELSKSARSLNMDEGGIYHLLSASARAADTALSKKAWAILRTSSRDSIFLNPASYLARLHALASAGDLDAAFTTLRELEQHVGVSQKEVDREIVSPFSSLRPLVLACTRGGAAALDAVSWRFCSLKNFALFLFTSFNRDKCGDLYLAGFGVVSLSLYDGLST